MNSYALGWTVLILLTASSLFFNKKSSYHPKQTVQKDTLIVFVGIAKEVMESKCRPCHSNKTWMPEARQRFNMDSINFLPIRKKVAKLDDIIYILEKGAMPHQRFMDMIPDAKLSFAERKAIEAWADRTAIRLTRSKLPD